MKKHIELFQFNSHAVSQTSIGPVDIEKAMQRSRQIRSEELYRALISISRSIARIFLSPNVCSIRGVSTINE